MNDNNRRLMAANHGASYVSRDGLAQWSKRPIRAKRCGAGSAMFSSVAWIEIASNLGLSARELQIVRGTFDDQTESSIATELHISPGTVHTHVERLHHKLGVTDRSQLILRVVQEYMALTRPPRSRLVPICARASAMRRLR
jgi:DNA-binding NarL/FixJ family response regulator